MAAHRSYRERKFAFGIQVLTFRTRASLTQSALASQIGVHVRSLQNWETGESYPKAAALQRLIAVLLRQHAFTHANEQAEAQALWSQAAQDGPHALASFDGAWFAGTLAQNDERGTQNDELRSILLETSPSSFSTHRSSLIDWGEAIAMPTLYGRERELATLSDWVVDERCRLVAIVGIGGIGKSSLALALAQRVLPLFDVVLFRSLQNGPPLAELLDQSIRAVSKQRASPPEQLSDKLALLIQLFRQRRCLLILDNFEAILQPGTLTGVYRSGYAEYGALLQALSEREHQSCLMLTSREKPSKLGPLEGRTAPVRSLQLSGLDDSACSLLLEAKDIVATAADLSALARLYGGNPLALTLVAEPIRELFGGDVGAFLAAGEAFVGGVGKLLSEQFARSTPLEQAIVYWLAVERELVPFSAVLANLGEAVPQREVLAALESLRRRMLIERGPDRPAFTLQPVILEFVTDQLVQAVRQEIVEGQPRLLHSHALIQASAKEYVRRSQEQLIATPLLERLVAAYGDADALERQFLTLLASWREKPLSEVGYGPGNLINLLRLLRGNLRSLDLSRLALRGVYMQGVEMQDATLSGATIRDSLFTETFDVIQSTSRERLRVQAEWLFDVDGLTYPPEDQHVSATVQGLADLMDYSAVELFVQRARQVQPGFSLSFPTLTTIVRICQYVAGMPLAIELAAAGVRTLSLAEIERQIGANLDVLATTHRDVPIRHRSMRAVFEHSWQLLSEGERALFSYLAVFRGGWTAAAAEAVCTQGQRQKAKGKNEDSEAPLLPFTFSVLPLLTALVDKSLVRQDRAETWSSAEHAAPNAAETPRFVMLEPIREYALEQLAARGEVEALRHAHASYYLALTEAAAAQWDSPTADVAIAQLNREHDNLRAALAWARDNDLTLGLQLGGALWRFWRRRGLISEGRVWLSELLALSDPAPDATRWPHVCAPCMARPG
jgi:predicted ATPase/transcriptional regulator with XRE-family HTH domain